MSDKCIGIDNKYKKYVKQQSKILLEMLQEYHNKKTKISVGNRTNIIKDRKRPKSLVLGVRSPFFLAARKDKTLNPHLTKHTQTAKGFEIYKLIYKLIGLCYPDFEFNQIIINFNTEFIPHKDSKNKNNSSFMMTVGGFTGGRLKLFEDDTQESFELIDINEKPILFDGKNTFHSTEFYIGERYCIVAYQTKTPYHFDPFEKEVIDLR